MRHVLLDVDGVLADFHKPTLEFLERRFGLRYDLSSFPTWDIFATVGREYQPETERHWAEEGWCAAIPLYEGAVEGVRLLRDSGAEVFFVTAQMTHAPFWMWERVQWLKRHFDADDRHVVFTLSKHLVVGDVLVDDKPSNVASWTAAHPTRHAVLWDQPTNAGVETPPGAVRCGSWADVARMMQ